MIVFSGWTILSVPINVNLVSLYGQSGSNHVLLLSGTLQKKTPIMHIFVQLDQ